MDKSHCTYQLVLLGPNVSGFERLHRKKLEEAVIDLGLNPESHLKVISEDQFDQLDQRVSLVGLWYGGTKAIKNHADHEAMLGTLLQCGATVIPLVEDLNQFSQHIPSTLKSLRRNNAIRWDDERVVPDVLKYFGLTRRQRQAFVSYKRTDSEQVAKQVAHTLFDRGYQVFLDTASVERGARFQDVLHDRLADTDLVVLLDSPNALKSEWVHEELNLVHQLGLGVLQLFWTVPDPQAPAGVRFQATKGTELSTERFPLEAVHFVKPDEMLGEGATLTPATLTEIANLAERARIRSLGSRRNRVISAVRAELTRGGHDMRLVPPGLVTIIRKGKEIATAYVVAGLPDALLINEHEERIADGRERREMRSRDFTLYRIVYDGLGILSDRLSHLAWLNDRVRLKTISTQRLHKWIARR